MPNASNFHPFIKYPPLSLSTGAASAAHQKIEVQVGDASTLLKDKDTVLETRGLSDCSAVLLMSDKNASSRNYEKRTLMHINGSCLSMGLFKSRDDIEKIFNYIKVILI